MMLLQTSKHTVIYTWYHLNKNEISSKHCKNLDKPELLCSGKCYVRTVVQADNQDEHSSTTPFTSMLNYLNLTLYITANPFSSIKFISNDFLEQMDSYQINYSFLLTHYIFHPPD